MRRKDKPVYERGKYRLVYDRRSDGTLRTPYLQIEWYDDGKRRVRSRSTGTADRGDAEQQLNALYLSEEKGLAVCSACGQQIIGANTYLVTEAIEAYLHAKKKKVSYNAIRPRLGHVVKYLTERELLATQCREVDEEWIAEFREWNIEVPVEVGNGETRERTPGTVEASVRQLAAAITFAKKHTLMTAQFSPKKPADVSHTPIYRASVAVLAAMFNYCTAPVQQEGESDKAHTRRIQGRQQLLRFLQISVATWARPDAAHGVSVEPKKGQWDSERRRLNLNPRGRAQTRKFRPVVPIARQMAPLFDEEDGFFVKVGSVRQAFEAMQDALDLPGDREAGLKLIRRSMAQHGRNRLGRRDWIEDKIMLGPSPARTV